MSDYIPTVGDRVFTPADTYRGQSNLQATPAETNQSNWDLQYGTGSTQAAAALAIESNNNNGTMLSPDEANKQTKDLGIDGLNFDRPISQFTLSMMQNRQKDYLKNQEIVANGSGLGSTTVGSLGIGLGASFLDPIDFGTQFVGGKAFTALKGAETVGGTIAARAVGRLGSGLAENAGIGGALGGINWYEASQEQRDYGLDDFLKSVGYGAVMGSAIHVAGGVIGDAAIKADTYSKIRDFLPPNAQTEALQLSNQGVYDFNDILGIQPKVIAAEKFLGRDLNQGERLNLLSRGSQMDLPENADLNAPKEALPSDNALDFIHPNEIAEEKVNRLRSMVNGDKLFEGPKTPLDAEEQPKVTLDQEPIVKGNIDDETTNLEKEVAELSKGIEEEPEQPKEGEKPLNGNTPEYTPEAKDEIANSKAALDSAQEGISNLAPREEAIRNASNCFLS